jgi:hypothetical protein
MSRTVITGLQRRTFRVMAAQVISCLLFRWLPLLPTLLTVESHRLLLRIGNNVIPFVPEPPPAIRAVAPHPQGTSG